MKKLDEIYMECPFYGQRKLRLELRDHGFKVGRNRVRRFMSIMGIEALARMPKTSKPCKVSHIYPYLLRNHVIKEVDEVWCKDITYIPINYIPINYIPMEKVTLTSLRSWTGIVEQCLVGKVSNTMDSSFCVRDLKPALTLTGSKLKIFNTDQGSQFSSVEWTTELSNKGIQISMDGKGRWMEIYNHRGKHQGLGYMASWSIYSDR